MIISVFATSMVGIFEPVFLYLLFNRNFDVSRSLEYVLLYYLIIYILYFFTVPLGAKFAKRFGYEYSMAISTIFTILFYVFLFWSNSYFWLIYLSIPMYVALKLFFWPAYHADFARFSSAGEQGREISNLAVMESLVCVLGPLIGGLILEFFGFKVLFVVVATLVAASNVPMLVTKEKFKPTPFSYIEAFKKLFAPENRRRFFALLGFGEELIAVVIWPIFIYLVVKEFLGLGLLSALSILVTTLIYLYIGKLADKRDRRVVSRYGSIFYFFGWLFRIIARGISNIFLVDVFSRLAKNSVVIPIVAATYEEAQDNSVMGGIVFFEMALVLGKILAMILALVLLQIFAPGWNALFILAGAFTLLYLLF